MAEVARNYGTARHYVQFELHNLPDGVDVWVQNRGEGFNRDTTRVAISADTPRHLLDVCRALKVELEGLYRGVIEYEASQSRRA